MENIIDIPGLQHLAEKVFLNLDYQNLEVCEMINQSSKHILQNPMFWVKKFVLRGMSKKTQTDWVSAIQSAKNSEKKYHILLYLKWILKKKKGEDLPCYTKSFVQKKFRKRIYRAAYKGHTEIVRKLAPLTENPNADLSNNGDTSIHFAAREGHAEIVKILAPLTDNHDAHDEDGFTPINCAVHMGHTEIVKILAPLTDIA